MRPSVCYFGLTLAAALICVPASAQKPVAVADSPLSNLADSFVVRGQKITTKSYLDEAWNAKGRPGLTANSGLEWNPATHVWAKKSSGLPEEALRGIAHYASWTAIPGRVGVNIAQTYHELDLVDELAKFYSLFLKSYFTTLGELRKIDAPDVRQRLLGPELGPDSDRTLVWYWQQSNGSVTLRDCYACNGEYFYPAARLVRLIATLKPSERTPAMNLFVGEYVPLLVKEHIFRTNFTDRMRKDMTPGDGSYKKLNMGNDEMGDVATAAEILGAHSADPKLVVIGDTELSKMRELVKVGVDLFQFSRTLIKGPDGRTYASYFNGDYDWSDDVDYSGYQGEAFPTPANRVKAKGLSWDVSHFSAVPMFLRSLNDNKAATGVDFPQQTDIDYIGNQYAFRVFEGDFKKPLFRNYFDGTDGWYRVSYLERAHYGIAPSRFCSMFDPSHGCTTIAGIYSWGLLASLNPDIAKVQNALIDLARSDDPSIACFQPQCFRERYYHYADASFSFLDASGDRQYPPALVVVLSELVLPQG